MDGGAWVTLPLGVLPKESCFLFSQEVSTVLEHLCFVFLHIVGEFNVYEAVVCQLYNFGEGVCVSASLLLAQSLLCLRIDWVTASSSFPFPVTTFSSFHSWKSIAMFWFLVFVPCLFLLVPSFRLFGALGAKLQSVRPLGLRGWAWVSTGSYIPCHLDCSGLGGTVYRIASFRGWSVCFLFFSSGC